MKIKCYCGSLIIDVADNLPWKGYLTPDQGWFSIFDAINKLIDAVANGRMEKEAAYHRASSIIIRSSRHMWQCPTCGRLYIDGSDGQLRCFMPEGDLIDREVLRGNPAQDE